MILKKKQKMCIRDRNIDVIVPFIEQLFNTKFLAKDVYYISEVPSQLLWLSLIHISKRDFCNGKMALFR